MVNILMTPIRTILQVLVVIALISWATFSAAGDLRDIGLLSLDPIGVEAYLREDFQTAYPRFLKDARSGNTYAMYMVGQMLQKGNGVPQNFIEANRWLKRSADKGITDALVSLADSYESGLGVKQDSSQSRKLYEDAAKQGNRGALYILGLKYANGKGVTQDDVAAASWFRRAAENGIQLAMISMGSFYLTGRGVQQNLVTAYAWFNLAAATKGPVTDVAIHNREQVANQLSADDIATGQRESETLVKSISRR